MNATLIRVGERASPKTEEEWQAVLAHYPMCRAEVLPPSAFGNAPKQRALDVRRVMGFTPCSRYPQAKVERLAGLTGQEEATVGQVLATLKGQVPSEDLLWLATQPGCYEHPERVLRWLAADFAAAVLPIVERDTTDRRPRRGIEAARLFALEVIDDVARDAAWAAAAWAGALAAARAAAGAAARQAAGAAAQLRQLERVIALLGVPSPQAA